MLTNFILLNQTGLGNRSTLRQHRLSFRTNRPRNTHPTTPDRNPQLPPPRHPTLAHNQNPLPPSPLPRPLTNRLPNPRQHPHPPNLPRPVRIHCRKPFRYLDLPNGVVGFDGGYVVKGVDG